MVKQGDIIKINFNPIQGHEQAGYRPGLVVSNNYFNKISSVVLVCPITNTNRHFPLHIPLDQRTVTTGFILCNQIKALDLRQRPYRNVEVIPSDLLDEVIDVLYAELSPEEDQ